MKPALSALFADASWEVDRNPTPVPGPVPTHNSHQKLVFLLGPWRAHHVAPIAHLKIPLVALDLRLAHELADAAPGVLAIKPDKLKQFLVLTHVDKNRKFRPKLLLQMIFSSFNR